MNRCLWSVAAALWLFGAPVQADLIRVNADITREAGTIPVNDLSSWVYDASLAEWIESLIPSGSDRLIVATQCYGGNMLSEFSSAANTTLLTASSSGRPAVDGGYHNDAAAALSPGSGRTAQTVHDAGAAGLSTTVDPPEMQETPQTGGSVAPGDFSLEPTSLSGPVLSRHVLYYAGLPLASDAADRDTIKANFAGQLNTTVTTVGGGAGDAGWDFTATSENLYNAIKSIGQDIASSSDPDKEQFILFLGDHGDYHGQSGFIGDEFIVVAPGDSLQTEGHDTFHTATDGGGSSTLSIDTRVLQADPTNKTGFSVFISPITLKSVPDDPEDYEPQFSPGDFTLNVRVHTITGDATPTATLTDFTELPFELGDDGFTNALGDILGEGITLFFEVAEQFFIDNFFDKTLDIELENHSSLSVEVRYFSQDTGAVRRFTELPEPASALLLTCGAATILARRRRVTRSPSGRG